MNKKTYSGVVAIFFVFMLGGLIAVSINASETTDSPAASKKDSISHMHHKLEEDQAPYKAKEAQALKELNEMTIRDDVRIEDVNAKIGELMAAKSQIMRLRYDHLIEMRRILTDEEKVAYDQNVLKRSAVR